MISGGERVTVNLITLRTTRYDATVPEEATLFSVEHPGGFGELDSAPGKVEQGDGFIRVTVPVEEGEVSLALVERSVSRRQYSLDSGDFERLVLDVRAGRIAVDAALSKSFDTAHDLLRRARAIEQEIGSLEDRQRELSSEQGRLRANLDAVEVESLRNRYIEALDSTETEIVAAADKLDALRKELKTVGTDLIALFDTN